MRTSPYRADRLLSRLLLTAVFVVIAVAAGAFRPAPTVAADPMYACYNRSTFSLRYVGAIPLCSRTEREVQLNDNRHPIWIFVDPRTHTLKYAGNAELPVASRCLGAAPTDYLQVPGDDDTPLCVTDATGALTFPPCSPDQTPITIPKRNAPPVADPKTAALLEDTSVDITLSATDADGQSLTFAIARQPSHGSLSGITGASCTGATPMLVPPASPTPPTPTTSAPTALPMSPMTESRPQRPPLSPSPSPASTTRRGSPPAPTSP